MTKEEFLNELFETVEMHARKQVERDHANHWRIDDLDGKTDRKMGQMIWFMAELAAKEPGWLKRGENESIV